MWIKMLRDQVGGDGVFLTGQTLSVPAKIIAKLDSDSYVGVEVSEERMRQMGIEDRLRHLQAESTTLNAAVESARARLNELYQRRKTIRARIKLAENELEGIAESKAETQQDSKDESND